MPYFGALIGVVCRGTLPRKLLRYRERVLRRELEFRTSVHRDNRSLGTLIALLRFRPARQHVRCVMLYEVLISTAVAMVTAIQLLRCGGTGAVGGFGCDGVGT